jgi:outer membrane protein TolC
MLRALYERGIVPDFMVGTSVGALNATFVASRPQTVETIDELAVVFTAGPTMSWRLFEGGRIRANIEVQNAREEQALHQYEKAVLTGLRDVEDSLVACGKERVRHESLAGALDANHRSVVLARHLYVHGLGTYLAALDAERTEYTAEDALAQGDESLVADLIATYKALGGGWELPDHA